MVAYLRSQLTRRPVRSLTVTAGIMLGAALFIALSALGAGFKTAARAPLEGLAADLLVTRPAGSADPAQPGRGLRLPFGSAPFTAAEVGTAQVTPGVVQVAGALEIWDFGATRYQTILGIDPTQAELGPAKAVRAGLVDGTLFTPEARNAIVVDRHYAAFFNLKVGSAVTLGDHTLSVIGIAEQPESSQAGVANFYVPLALAQEWLGLPAGHVNQVYVRVGSANNVEPVVAGLTQQLGTISAMSQASILQVMGGVARVSSRFAQLAGGVGLLGGVVLTWVALAGLLAERRHDIGVMKALGWRRRDIRQAFLLEAAALSLTGGLAGAGLGMLAVLGMSYLPAPQLSLHTSLPGLAATAPHPAELGLPVQVSLNVLLISLVVTVGGGLLASWINTRRLDRQPTAALLRQL